MKRRALPVAPGVNGRQLINEDEGACIKRDLQRVASGKSDDLAVLAAKVELIGEELAALWQQVADLEAQLAGQRLSKQRAPRTRIMLEGTAPEQAALSGRSAISHALPNGLREGLVIVTNLAHEHFPTMTVEQIGRMLQMVRENRSVPMVAEQIAKMLQLLHENRRAPMVVGKFRMGKVAASYTLDAAGRRAICEVKWEHEDFSLDSQGPHFEW